MLATKFKKCICFFLSIALILLISACGTFGERYQMIQQPKIYVEYNEYLGYSAEIKGKLKNTSMRDYDYVSVEFSVYDKNGNNLGTALDNINNLRVGDTWNFSANLFSFPSSKPTRFELIEVTMW